MSAQKISQEVLDKCLMNIISNFKLKVINTNCAKFSGNALKVGRLKEP